MILDEIENEDRKYILADKTSRFGHHVVDAIIGFILFLSYVFIMESFFGVIQSGNMVRPLGGLLLYIIYYTVFEYLFSKTPGKFLTKTKVVDLDGAKPSFAKVLLRSICRLIPFDGVSFLLSERGWHDQLSRTAVVKE